jgi:hypothetical protein
VVSIPTHCGGLSKLSDADSISDSSNAHVDTGGHEALLSSAVRELCDQLRANDPRVLADDSVFELLNYTMDYSEAERIAIFQALKENTSVKHIDFSMLSERHNHSKRSALAAAEYVESSKTLQVLDLSASRYHCSPEVREMASLVLCALSRNTSVTKLIINTHVVRFASVAFEELLTCTQTLQKLKFVDSGFATLALHEVQIAAIASVCFNNTTLRDLEFSSWREADLPPVLTALHCQPALQKIHLSTDFADYTYLSSLSGHEVLLRSQDSKVKQLILAQVDTRTIR